MKKRNKQIYISNLWLYMFIIIGILVIIGTGVYAASYSSSGAGHPYTEISTCGANQVLKMNSAGTAWTCQADAVGTGGGITVETDPIVEVSVKDGVTWYEITDRPSGVDNGDQLGITSVGIDSSRTSCTIPGDSSGTYCAAHCPYGTKLTGCGASEVLAIWQMTSEPTHSNPYCQCYKSSSSHNPVTCYAICLRVSLSYS